MSRTRKIVVTLATVSMLALLGIYVYAFWLGGVEQIVNGRLEAILSDKYDLNVRVGKLSGDVFTGLILEDVTVSFDDSVNQYQMLYLPRLSTAYTLSNIWNRNYSLEYLYLDSAEITLMTDTSGKWMLPEFQTGESGKKIPTFSVEDLGLRDLILHLVRATDTLSLNNITLEMAVQGDERTYSVDLERFEFTSNRERIELDAAGGKVTYSEGVALLDEIELTAGDTRLRLSGYIKRGEPNRGRLDFTADGIDLTAIARYVGPKLKGNVDINGSVEFEGSQIRGTVDLAGDLFRAHFDNMYVGFHYDDRVLTFDTLYGSVFHGCSVDGSGEMRFVKPEPKYQLSANIENFDLSHLLPWTFESDLTGHINLKGSSFKKERMLLNVEADLFESSFADYPLHKATGDITITADSISFHDPFVIDYYENMLSAKGVVVYRDSIDLDVTAQLLNLDRYRGKFFIKEPGGRGVSHFRFSGLTKDPDLSGHFASDSLWVYGLYADSTEADFDIKRFLTRKSGDVQVSFHSGLMWSIPYEATTVDLSIDSDLVYIREGQLSSPNTRLSATGLLDYMVYPQQLTIDTVHIEPFGQEFYNRNDIEIRIDSAGFIFDHAALWNESALLSVLGRADYDESLDLILTVKKMPITPWISLFDTVLTTGGLLSGDARLTGTLDSPEFEMFCRIDSLLYKDLVLGDLSAAIDYKDQLVTLDSLKLVSDSGQYEARGLLYADLAFSSQVDERLPDRPMNLSLSGSDRQFELVTLVMPSVEKLTGEFSGMVQLTGTPFKPHLEGVAWIRNARLKYFDLAHPLFCDSIGVKMIDNKILFDHAELYATTNKEKDGSPRYAIIDGEIVVKALDSLYYDLDVSLPREFPFSYELDDIKGKAEGDFHIVGYTPQLVTGDITLIAIRYGASFADEDEGSPVMEALMSENSWDLNIDIDILSNYRIKNEDIDAEFSGKLNLVREKGVYRFSGEMEILRGRGFLMDKTFRLEQGSKVIFEGGDTLNPRLDITGYARIAGIRSGGIDEAEAPEQIELCIQIGGTLNAPQINPCEGSEFSREDILPIIIANYYSNEQVSSSGHFEQRLFGLGFSQVSQIGARQLSNIGVETFEIDPVYGDNQNAFNARVTVGGYAASNLYLYARSTLTGQTRQEAGFEYRLNRAFQIEGRRDEAELYHLNLKLHWEF